MNLERLKMIFKSKEPSLVVFVEEGKDCIFRNGYYETEDEKEIEALHRAKGVSVFESSMNNGVLGTSKNQDAGSVDDETAAEKAKESKKKETKTLKTRARNVTAGSRSSKKRPGRPRKLK